MSIARLRKVTLAGTIKDKHTTIERLQQFGHCHVIDADDSERQPSQFLAKDRKVQEAYSFLMGSKFKRRSLTKSVGFKFNDIIDQAITIKNQLRSTEDQLEKVNDRIVKVMPWGDFIFPPSDYVNHFRFWFYLLPVSKRSALTRVALPWQIVGRSNTKLYVVIISGEEPGENILPVAREHLGAKSLNQLLEEQEQLETQRDELVAQREALTRFLYLIRKHLVHAHNEAHYKYVLQQLQQDDQFFTLQAWLPKARLVELERLAVEYGFAFIAEKPTAKDNPPTLLEPKQGFDSGAQLAAIYQTPGYKGWDPSAHLYFSFSAFFAMILSDAGYGLLLAVVLGFFWRWLGDSVTTKALRSLMSFMTLSSVIWGVLVGSYFGYGPPAGSVLESGHIITLTDYDLMMRLSVGIGVVHIVLANATAAWAQRYSLLSVCNKCGWIILTLSGYSLWLFEAEPSMRLVSSAGMVFSAAAIVVGNGKKPIAGPLTVLQNLISGLLALTNVTKLFGDVLSYMRLFALGLASASLAVTFNQLSASGFDSGGFGIVTGSVIFLIGHMINLALAIMGGVVHGLRLNFIEFYNWSEPGEGYVFSPFKLLEVKK